jgi:hypothetical protein
MGAVGSAYYCNLVLRILAIQRLRWSEFDLPIQSAKDKRRKEASEHVEKTKRALACRGSNDDLDQLKASRLFASPEAVMELLLTYDFLDEGPCAFAFRYDIKFVRN